MMNFPARRLQAFKPATEKPYNVSYVVGMSALLMVLIMLRAFDNRLVYLFMGVSGIVFLLSAPRYCVTMLFFLLPFSSFLKPHPDSMSFFTVLFFLTVAKLVIANRKISVALLMSAIAFFVYHLIFSGMRELTTVITMIAGCLLLYYIRQEKIHIGAIVFAFAAGICLSSILALLRDYLPLVNTFVREIMLKMGEGEYQNRFSGFGGNPNYYTMSIVMAQAALLVLMYQEKKQTIYMVMFSVLSVFGFTSVSQSFLVVWMMLVFFWFLISLQKGIGNLAKFVFVAILGLSLMSYFAFDYLVAFAYRLFEENQGTLSSATTGRTDIWVEYLDAIFSDMRILFFGNGINTLLFKKGTHNTYLESVFYFGLCGTTILCAMLRAGMQKIITAKIMWIPVLTLMVRMLAIGFITQDDLWFYLGLVVVLSGYCSKESINKNLEDRGQVDVSDRLVAKTKRNKIL